MPTTKTRVLPTLRSLPVLMVGTRSAQLSSWMTMARSLRIFIAEDSAHVLKALKSLLLSIQGVEVIGDAAEAGAALDSIRRTRPDVAIIDLRLASGSGLDILRGLQHEEFDRPVRIVFTNQAEARWRAACVTLGAEYFFTKSADADQLADLVRSMVSAAGEVQL